MFIYVYVYSQLEVDRKYSFKDKKIRKIPEGGSGRISVIIYEPYLFWGGSDKFKIDVLIIETRIYVKEDQVHNW